MNFRVKLIAVFFVAVLTFGCNELFACSAFSYKANDNIYVCKNFDWMINVGHVVVNKSGMAKKALLPVTNEKALAWVSKYGSITFNQYGREYPLGGMNEKGLVIEILWLSEAKSPVADSRPAIDVLPWIQYQLDCSSNLDEVKNSLKDVRISSQFRTNVHFFICDLSGRSAAVEFYGSGEKFCITENDAQVLENVPYERSIKELRTCDGFGGSRSMPKASYNKRFFSLAQKIKDFSPFEDVKENLMFGIDCLEAAHCNRTVWQIIYSITDRKVYYRIRNVYPVQWRTIDFDHFSYKNDTPVLYNNMLEKQVGDISRQFKEYSSQANGQLVKMAISNTPGTLIGKNDSDSEAAYKTFMAGMAEIVSRYPDSENCKPDNSQSNQTVGSLP